MFDNYICVLPVLTREDTCMSIEILCQLRFSYERPFASHMEGKDGGHSAAVILNSESKRTDNRHKSRLGRSKPAFRPYVLSLRPRQSLYPPSETSS
jgi:hypothetical protein